MKHPSLTLLFLFLIISVAHSQVIDSLFTVFEKELTVYQQYIGKRQQQIEYLTERAQISSLTNQERYLLYRQLFEAYRPYQCDSAAFYLEQITKMAEVENNLFWKHESQILLANLLGSVGYYLEAIEVISAINRSTLPKELLSLYYEAYNHIYGEASFYGMMEPLKRKYRGISDDYRDSLYSILPHGSDQFLKITEEDYRLQHNYTRAIEINNQRLHTMTEDSPEYAMIAYFRALTYKFMENHEAEKEWLLRSAIADIRFGITDNGSAWNLAFVMYHQGDIQRAQNYINYSMDNSIIFNARLRQMQIGAIQPIISKSYQLNKKEQEQKLHNYLILISLLSVLLLFAAIGIFIQNKKIVMAHRKAKQINKQLQELNMELKQINTQLQHTNFELTESNHIKEEYIGHFLTLCSSYIDKLNNYRRNISKRLHKGEVQEVIEMCKAPRFLEEELEQFYMNFDTTFLRIYPNFVEEFNQLLLDEEHIILKKGELLNTELRIFALIRLGISNSAKIAELLRYSANTIYNYRAKIKNKSKGNRDDFEKLVLNIGMFTK